MLDHDHLTITIHKTLKKVFPCFEGKKQLTEF